MGAATVYTTIHTQIENVKNIFTKVMLKRLKDSFVTVSDNNALDLLLAF